MSPRQFLMPPGTEMLKNFSILTKNENLERGHASKDDSTVTLLFLYTLDIY